jgi:hypothetical protein
LARAESTLVVLVRPSADDARATEVMNLARGELLADRFKVVVSEALPNDARAASLSRAGTEAGADVTIGLFVENDAHAIELWLVDRLADRVLVRRVEGAVGSAEASSPALARHTVDRIRTGLFELLFQSIRSGAAEPHPRFLPDADRPRWAIEFGAAGLESFGRLGPAILPVLRVRFALADAWQLRATGAWLGTRPRVDAEGGSASATVNQGLTVLEGVLGLWPQRPLHPALSLGAGVYYVGVEGSALPPNQAERDDQLALVVDGGAGLTWRAAPHFEVTLEGHVLLTEPGIGIRLLGVPSATLGRPSAMVTLTLASWI